MKVPEWTEFLRVDQIIECVSLGINREEITKELLNTMPDAYDIPTPGEDDSPWEIDHPNYVPKKLARIWYKLKPETRLAIKEGVEKDFGEWYTKEDGDGR